MFDVYWTDPDRELVGEHRARKEKKREQKAKKKEREQETSTIPGSASIASTTSSTESRFGFLRPRNGKQAKNRDKVKTGLLTPSQHSSRSNSGSYHRPALMANLSEVSLGAARAQKANIPASASTSASINETHNCSRRGSGSYVIKHAGASQTPPRSESDKPELSIDMRVSSEADVDHPATPSDSIGEGHDPVPLLQNDSIPCLVPSIRLPKASKAPIIINFRPNDPDSWRPPEEWEYIDRLAEEVRQAAADEDVEMKSQTDSQVQPNREIDFEALKSQVNQMAAASPAVVLARIKEIWSVNDESLHPELNMELKRWMLSILNHMDIEQKNSPIDASNAMSVTANLKILALYESSITTAYLAALHPTKQVHHISAEPLSTAQFAKVHPILVPSVSTSTLPLEKHIFDTVYSLSLPSASPSTEIPGVLKNISKHLRVGGSLHLTLIDPLPCAGTLGHRMRTWLEEHLLINLERHFRCTNPSKLFPDWMGDAGLRGQGSTLTTSKFYAVSASIRSQVDDNDPFVDKAPSEREVKAEVRSIVGRLLWMEVWGNFVTGEKWWWEDEGCVNECLQLGTVWDYHIIDGVKPEETLEQIEEEP
ncbi:hypothetical protein FVEN_g12270 [Fusarium venenatum]|uniref:Uncharacterized protein n=1 Tax=Fusarium venenatum TaxID=56646 RepID=A0A2L2TM61_9HYPO|nr:uncharacterized protein FVRRES_02209 [Fusarium venenatum]KAG8349511.1 hypothetical protein FVEN_g12270 [Fusarium venenatum]KAH7004666.1 hypothetical protein EDB82DRAFT_551130 [Fusarium venenatum]CEI65697.1 unnamed protein product [Fusarium venenatum]